MAKSNQEALHMQLTGGRLFAEIKRIFFLLLEKDRSFLAIVMIYGVAISLLTLAVPVSVQMLINSVAHIASPHAIGLLAMLLLGVMLVYAVLNAMQFYMMEMFERRFYARITSEFTLRSIYAEHSFYENINRYELVNRYFDIMNVQKIVPSLVIGLFSIFLQMAVGITLVSFYHPWLFLFNMCFLLALYAIWRVWGYSALKESIYLSEAKYRTARHLEDIARANSFFKAARHIDYAIEKIDRLTAEYIGHRKKLFRLVFKQHVALLLLYALASAGLLGIGGLQVINGQLTLGQLVAAELILSAVFYSVSTLANYFRKIYDLGASVEEIQRMFDIPLEEISGHMHLSQKPASIVFKNTEFFDGNSSARFDFTIPAGGKIMANMAFHTLQNMMLDAVKRYREPQKGSLLIGDMNILDLDKHDLREQIVVLDRPTIIETTVKEYLQLGKKDATISEMNEALAIVELDTRIQSLPDGMDTQLTVTGNPLTVSETLRLKLAAALLKSPHVLIVNEFFDTISYARRKNIFTRLCAVSDMTLIYFSNREDLDIFDDYLFIGEQHQLYLGTAAALREYEGAHENEEHR
jgi:putative ABC transport system ATP-binding protein